MKEIKFIHLGDIHMDFEDKYRNKIMPSLEQVKDYCKGNKITAIIIPGDIWHRKQSYINKSGVPLFISWLREISKLVDFVFITKGNHDDVGSISLLHQLESNIFAYEYPVVLSIYREDGDNFVKDILRYGSDPAEEYKPDCIVSLIPYPTKAGFITETSIDNNNADFLEIFEQLFEMIGEVTQPYTCPKILGFHGNVVGSRLSTGQTLVSQDIMVAPATLLKANHDYYALNHIHLRQEIRPNMIYAGGVANFNWGETEQKSFEVIEFVHQYEIDLTDYFEMNTKQIMLESSRPMVKLSGEFSDGKINIERGDYLLGEFRLRIDVKENDRKLITDAQIEELKDEFGDDVKIEWNIIPDERESRSEEIMNCRTLLDEVTEFAKVTEFELTDSIKDKVYSLQNDEVFV